MSKDMDKLDLAVSAVPGVSAWISEKFHAGHMQDVVGGAKYMIHICEEIIALSENHIIENDKKQNKGPGMEPKTLKNPT